MRTELEYYHVHTMLSNIFTQPDSCVSIPEYAKVFKARGNKTLCLTEHGNRSDIFEQYTVANKLSDSTYTMKAIPGAEFYFVPNNDPALKDDRNFHLVVIGKNNEALKQLNKMASLANEFGYYRHARIDFNLLEQLDYRNFIVTTACVGGIFKDPNGLEYCKKLHDIFKENFYLEVQPHLKQEQIDFNKKILDVYQDTAIPLILGTDSHYINKEDGILRKELIAASNIHYDDGDWDLYLPTAEEAYNMMVEQHVLPRALIEEAMENTLILREFDGVTFDTSRKFPIAKDKQNMTQEQRNYLYQKMVCEGYIKQFGMPNEEEKKELRREMNIVLETNSADYFIGLHDMIERGVQNGGLLTKTSRGSACGFVSNAALGLTTINRLHTQVPLFAERFVTPAKLRVSMPDIDSNISNLEAFEQAGREVFGDHSCYPMIAYGKNKTLSAFKMLARSRGIDFTIANDIAKQINKYELDKKHAFENNQDDPDYNVDDDVVITNYIDSKYMPIIEDSKQYENIIVSVSPRLIGAV